MINKMKLAPSFFERYYKPQDEWEYIEEPTYSRSIGSHVCFTCSKFRYASHKNLGSILFCEWHQKLISHGLHLTHSCEIYQQ